MADTVQTLALLVLAQVYRGNIVRQINRQSVALKLLKWVEGAGQNVAFVPKGSGVVAEMYTEGADATNFGSDAQVKALLPWGMARANFHVSGLAEATSASTATPQGNQDIWGANMADGASALSSLVNGQIYTGNGSAPNLVGLDQAIGTANNTYAGIDRTVATYFAPNVFNAAGPAAALSFDLIRSDLAAILVASGRRPDLALVHPNVWRKIAGLFDPQKLFLVQTMDVETARGKVSLQGGVAAISFDGCYFVEDKDATDGCIYYLATDHVRIEYLPLDLANIPGIDDEILDFVADDGFGITPMGMRLEMLAKTGDSEKAQMKTYLQVVCDRPNSCGKRLNIL